MLRFAFFVGVSRTSSSSVFLDLVTSKLAATMAAEVKDVNALEKEVISSDESLRGVPGKTPLDDIPDPDAGKSEEERKELVWMLSSFNEIKQIAEIATTGQEAPAQDR